MEEKRLVVELIGLINFPLDNAIPKNQHIKNLEISLSLLSEEIPLVAIKKKLSRFYRLKERTEVEYEKIFHEIDKNSTLFKSTILNRGNSIPNDEYIEKIYNKVCYVLNSLVKDSILIESSIVKDFIKNSLFDKNSKVQKKTIMLFSDFIESLDWFFLTKKTNHYENLMNRLYSLCPKIDFSKIKIFN